MFWFKVALFFHLFIGSIMLSNQSFFPEQDDEDSKIGDIGEESAKYLEKLDIPYANNFIAGFFVRLTSGSQSTLYLTFIVLLVAAWILLNILDIFLNFFGYLFKPIIKCIAKCCSCCCKKHKVVKSKDIYKEFTALSLENMFDKAS